jgi:non-specific serine/threonine protein kinase
VLQGDVDQGRRLLEQGLADATELGRTTWRAHALHGLALTALFWEEPAEALAMLEEALSLHRQGDDPLGVPLAHIQLATLHATLGESDPASAHAEECIALSERTGDQWCAAMARWTQALVAWREGRAGQVRACAREVLRLKEPFGDRLGMAMSMEMLAWTASKEGRHAEAAQLLGAVQSALSSIGGSLFRHLRVHHDRCATITRSALGESEFDRCVAAGASLPFEGALALALGRRQGVEQLSRPSARHGATLTRRETEVARLVAEGLTDREIAARLVVAQRTAEGHVQRVLTKLALTSRQQLAGWVAERCDPPLTG